MKKILSITLMALVFVGLQAQTEYDALRLSQTDIQGTARYMSLAGAMGALGADASAIKDNPAGLGVYRSSELTATLDVSVNDIKPIVYHNRENFQPRETNTSFSNVSYVVNMPVYDSPNGLVNSNFSFSFQKLADFNKYFSVEGGMSPTSFTDFLAGFSSPDNPIPGDISYNNPQMPWITVLGFNGYLIDPDGDYFKSVLHPGERVLPAYTFEQYGSMNELNFGWGGNYNNNFFVGASMNIRTIDYSLYSRLTEDFEDGGGFDLDNILLQNGVGLNAKLGMIYQMNNGLRLGLSFHTPTINYIEEESRASLDSSLIPEDEQSPSKTETHYHDYNLWSPMQLQASAAYVFGKSGFLSAEYNLINYNLSKFERTRNSAQDFAIVNRDMAKVLNSVHLLKLGAEGRLSDKFSLRAGYAFMSPATNQSYEDGKLLVQNTVNTNTEYFDQKFNTNLLSLGLGYRSGNWFLDFAYSNRLQKEEFYPYQDRALSATVIDNNRSNYTFTIGLRM